MFLIAVNYCLGLWYRLLYRFAVLNSQTAAFDLKTNFIICMRCCPSIFKNIKHSFFLNWINQKAIQNSFIILNLNQTAVFISIFCEWFWKHYGFLCLHAFVFDIFARNRFFFHLCLYGIKKLADFICNEAVSLIVWMQIIRRDISTHYLTAFHIRKNCVLNADMRDTIVICNAVMIVLSILSSIIEHIV